MFHQVHRHHHRHPMAQLPLLIKRDQGDTVDRSSQHRHLRVPLLQALATRV